MNCITGPAIFSSKTITWGRERLVCDSNRGLFWSQIGEGIENHTGRNRDPQLISTKEEYRRGWLNLLPLSYPNLNRLRPSPPREIL